MRLIKRPRIGLGDVARALLSPFATAEYGFLREINRSQKPGARNQEPGSAISV